jgi:membrane-associated phospholipid phosphatase
VTRAEARTLAAAYAAFCALYLGASALPLREPVVLAPSALDRAIPLVGWTVWVYLSQFALLGVVFLRAAGSPAWGRALASMLVATLVSVAVFVAFPTRVARAAVDGDGLTALAFQALHLVDPPGNCFPSLHVSLAFLGALALRPEQPRAAAGVLAWAALIALSTLTTRQHVLLDVAGGAAVALASRHLASRLQARWAARAPAPAVRSRARPRSGPPAPRSARGR